MGRNRKPKAIAERDGSFEKHPERKKAYEFEPKPAGPLGPPPAAWLPHPRTEEAATLFASGVSTFDVAKQLGMTYNQAKACRPGEAAGEEALLLQAWRDIEVQAPPGVLMFSDRLWVEMTCYSLVRVRQGKAKSSDRNAVKEFLGKMAMNPADRSKVNVAPSGASATPAQSDGSERSPQNPFEQIAAELRNEESGKLRPN
jgi:hypothetical protein